MGKKKLVKQELYGNIMDTEFDSESMEGPMAASIMIQASNHQMLIAIELTKLIVSKGSHEKDMEEHVFSVFKKAIDVAVENFPLKNLLDHFEE